METLYCLAYGEGERWAAGPYTSDTLAAKMIETYTDEDWGTPSVHEAHKVVPSNFVPHLDTIADAMDDLSADVFFSKAVVFHVDVASRPQALEELRQWADRWFHSDIEYYVGRQISE